MLPGGFPEEFTAELSANDVVRQQIRRLAASGAPVHAECAGLTYLVDDLDGIPMCGVLSGSARFTDRLTLGYRDAVATSDSSMHAAGTRVVGPRIPPHAQSRFGQAYEPAWRFGRGASGRSWPTAPCTPGCTPAICTPMPRRIPGGNPLRGRGGNL